VGWEQIALTYNGDGRLELFVLASGVIYHLWQTDAAGHWSAAESFPGAHDIVQIAVAANPSGGIDVCAMGGDGNVWYFSKASSAMNRDWNGSISLNTPSLDGIVLAQNDADHSLALYGLAGSGVWLTTKTSDGHWHNSKKYQPPNDVTQIAVAKSDQNTLQVVALASGTIWFYNRNQDKFQQIPQTSGIVQIAAANVPGDLEVFALGADNRVWHFAQAGNTWSGSGFLEF
jgi:hypothetical protein